MAVKLKDHYNTDYAQSLSKKIKAAYPDFPDKRFIKYVKEHIDNEPPRGKPRGILDAALLLHGELRSRGNL